VKSINQERKKPVNSLPGKTVYYSS